MNKNILKDFSKYVSFNILGTDCLFLLYTGGYFLCICRPRNKWPYCSESCISCILYNQRSWSYDGIGGSSRFSILKSRTDSKTADQIFTNAFILVFMFAAIFFFAGFFASRPLTILLGANNQVFEITNIYLKTLMLFAPAFMLNHLLQCFVRNDGHPSLSMTAMMTGSFSNIILDYIFIFPFNMGIFGAAFCNRIIPCYKYAHSAALFY